MKYTAVHSTKIHHNIQLFPFHSRSPAPSQSEAVMIGDCKYRNPSSWKNLCVAKASADRTLDTADIVFVRALKCAIVLRNSMIEMEEFEV